MQQTLQERIRERAYELWDASGRMEGQADQYWLAAERELLNKMAGQIASVSSASAPEARLTPARRANRGARQKKMARAV